MAPSVEQLAQASRHGIESVLQTPTRPTATAKQVPGSEDFLDDLQALAAKRPGRTPAIDTLLEVPLEMCPAHLPQSDWPAIINAPAVAAQNAVDSVAQQGNQAVHAALAVNDEGGHAGRGGHPEPCLSRPSFQLVSSTFLTSACLTAANASTCAGSKAALDFLLQGADRAQADGSLKNVARSPRQPVWADGVCRSDKRAWR